MWNWLTQSNNSAAIQGLAAMLNLLVTLVLAVLTGWYVLLTHRMLKMQQALAESSITARVQELMQTRQRLVMLVGRFRKILDQIPWEERDLHGFTRVTLWSESDMEGLQEAVLAARPESADIAGEFVDSVRWLATEQRRVQADPPEKSTLQIQEYQHRLIAAKMKLADVAMLLTPDQS